MTKALITGMGGFVGSHLAEYLLAHTDWSIVGTLRHGEPIDNLQNLAGAINRRERIEVVDLDINDALAVYRLLDEHEPDYVFHLAAQSFPLASYEYPEETIRTNILGTLHVLEACLNVQPWIHVCSSAEVYGKTTVNFITEDTPFHAASPYSLSKIGTDLLGQLYASYGLNVIVTRMFSHTGPGRGDVFAESSFAKQIAMIEAGLMEPPIKVGNLESVRTVADVRDAVRAYHMALTVRPEPGAVYNIGGTHVTTIQDVLDALFEAAGERYAVEVDPSRLRPVDADFQIPDCTKFTRHTGWHPRIPFEKTMADLLAYWRGRVRYVEPLQR